MDKWLKQFKENYEGKSAEAKEVADYVKETFNGKNYIPWATMERLTYMQDPNAKFEKIRNEKGGLVHTDSFINENLVENKDGIVSKTSACVMSHFVKVSLVFMGKEFIEEYPIQEQDYTAAKIYNQNLVNRSLQRAMTKVASRATGIGLKLYEQKDLQFDEKEEEKKPEIKKTTKKEVKIEEPKVEVKEKVKEEPKVEESVVETSNEEVSTKYDKDVIEACNLIKTSDKEKMTKILQSLNVSILKQHKFTLNLDDTDDELCGKLDKFNNVPTFIAALNKMLSNMN